MSTYDDQSLFGNRKIDGTDQLAFDAVRESEWSPGESLLDFGCGAGRSTSFLLEFGSSVSGVDINNEIIEEARKRVPEAAFYRTTAGQPLPFPDQQFDGFFSSWSLLEESSPNRMAKTLQEIGRTLRPGGSGVIITNTEAFYLGQWLTCYTDFPENEPPLRSGQTVKVKLLPDGPVVTDTFWSDDDYHSFFELSGFSVESALYPLAKDSGSSEWKDETHSAPYVVYFVRKDASIGNQNR
ncbi:MAG: class I SAM-dependent methyltransferase [Verrucomicrobiota bacterium]